MYTPTAFGGHARYTQELLTALSRCPGVGGVELVTSEDVDARFRTGPYPVHPILPRLAHRREFATRLHWAASRLAHYPRCDRRFLRWLRGRPDVTAVHFQEHQPWRAGTLFAAVRAMGKAVFYTVHNVRPHAYPPFVPKSMVDRWDRRAWKLCDGLFVLSDQLKQDLSEFLGHPHPPIHVTPHGTWSVGEGATAPLDAPPPLEERLRWKRLLFFGTIRRNKGLDVLLRAMESLPGYSLTVAGEPKEREYFEAEVLPRVAGLRAKGVKVELIDRFTPDEELGRLFAGHSALVLPYTKQFTAQSGVLFMALAYEVPIVASNVAGLRDLFTKFRGGLAFSAESVAELARQVRELHEGPRREDLAAHLRAARQHYSWETAAEETVKAYGAGGAPVGRAA
jgi:glycosyltransferase involved in cell wall biosynthesis